MKLINRHIIHSLSKTFVFACGLTVFLILFDLSVTYAQDFSQYAGTHTGKFEFTTPKSVDVTWSEPGGEQKKIKKNVEPDAKLISEINEVSFTISSAGDITITFHAKIRWGNIKSDSKGTLTGKLNSDLSFDITGNTSYEYTLASMSPVSIQDPRTFKGKIADNKISGWMGAPEGKDRSTYSIDLSADVKGGDCDCEITVPSHLKPGGSLYVVTKTSGCVKSEVIYYNGKDRQISNWDGKAVKVEVQMTCCNGRAFFKTFQIPAYESNEKIEITSTETSKGGNLPAPPAGQVLFGSAAALAIIKLLETLLAGSGKGPKPVPPVAPKKPPPHNPYLDKDGNPRKDLPPLIPMEPWENAGAKSPKEYEEMLKSQKEYEDTIKQREKEYGDGKTESDKKEVKPDEKKQKKDKDDKRPDRKTDDREAGKEIGKELGKDISDIIKIVKEEGKDIGKDISDTRKEVRDVIDKSKTEKKKIILSPENKKDLREFLNEKQKWLEKNAEREKKYAGDNPAAITKSLIQTVPNSYKEVDNLTYRTFEKYFEVKQVVNNFTNEMDKNPLEGLKMLGNVETAVQNIKKSASDYISDGRLKNDLYNAGKNVVNTNVEFVSNLIKNPGKTITTYVNTAVGSENWKNSWDMNKPLETRLLNAGAGIIKTCSTLGSLNMAGGLLKGAPTVKGFLSANVINSLKVNWILLMHQKNMYMHKLEQMFPGLLSEAKFKFVYNLTKVELNHYVNHPDSNAPMVENVNDWLENFNKSFGKKN